MAEDEDLRIEALRQELMREIDAVRNDAKSIGGDIEHRFEKTDTDVENLRHRITGLIAVFGLIAAILAIAVSILALAANVI
ncbi:MAG: hypothetical protein H0V53_00725 [Rubrobacter sp.]|nr:hypothetical protein [Rubrobacter sp.]